MSDSNPYYFVDTAISAAQTHEIVRIGVFAALLAAQVASAGAVVGRMRAAGPHANGVRAECGTAAAWAASVTTAAGRCEQGAGGIGYGRGA